MKVRMLAIGILASSACAGVGGMSGDQGDDYEDVYDDLNGAFGKGDILPDPCEILGPFLEFGDDAIHSGLVIGVEGEGVLGGIAGFGGWDIVWDLYHQQMTVSRYKGFGIAPADLAGGSVTGYVGAAFGFDHGVADWDGYFVTGTANIGLPFLDDFVSLSPSVYVSGKDDDNNQIIDPTEILVPPNGVYGFNLGVSLGASVPDPIPIEGSLTEGLWLPHDEAIARLYHRFKDKTIFGLFDMQARLIDHHDGSECSDDWPNDGSGKACIIEFGDPNTSYTKRALHTAASICDGPGEFTAELAGCHIPLSWPMSTAAIAIGVIRDTGLKPSEFCSDGESGGDSH